MSGGKATVSSERSATKVKLTQPLVLAIITQALGVGSQILAVVLIARTWGPLGQGSFGVIKSWNDFLANVLPLGLPQGFVYALNKGDCGHRYLSDRSLLYALAAVVVGFPITYVAYSVGLLPVNGGQMTSIVLLSIGVGTYTYFSLLRAIYLTVDNGVRFSVLTITPAIALILSVSVSMLIPSPSFELVFAFVGISSAITARLFAHQLPRSDQGQRPAWRPIIARSLNAMVQALLIALQPVMTFSIMRLAGADLDDLGQFNLAIVVVLALNSLIAMIAPILYNHWSKTLSTSELPALLRTFVGISLGVGLVSGPPIMFGVQAIPMLIGEQFSAAIAPIRLMALIAAPLIFTRLCLPALLAVGMPWLATHVGLWRVLIILAGFGAATLSGWSILIAASFAWVTAEWAVGILLFWQVSVRARRLAGRGRSDVLPSDLAGGGDLI